MKIMDLDDAIRILRRNQPLASVDFEHDQIFVDGPPPNKLFAANHAGALRSCGFEYDDDLGRWKARA